ncbi:MAG: cytochrome c-type biogenesis protein CcmH [Candidatus Limnocylindrales bacterium]
MSRPARRAAPLAALLGSVAAIAVAAVLASSAPRDPSARARAVEAALRCPTCQATSVADSPALAARQMRRLVEQQVLAGQTDDQIRAFFAARFGRWILLDPPAEGTGLVVWLLPATVVVCGVLLLARRTRRGRGERAQSGTVPQPTWGRAAEIAILGAMLAALAAPIPAALGSRPAGSASSGGTPSATPSVADLEAWVAAQPTDVAALTALGNALLDAGNLAEAADRYRAALAVDPAATGPRLGLAAILIESGRPDVAARLLEAVLASDPANADAVFLRMVAGERLYGRADARVRADATRFLGLAPADDVRRAVADALLPSGGADPSPAVVPGTGSPAP